MGLDPPSIRDLVDVLTTLKKAGDRTLVIVSHDVDDFLPLLDFLLVLDKGRQAAYGSVMDVCESLGDNAGLRCLLPRLAMLVYDLDKAGHPLAVDNFEITTMAEQLTNLLDRDGGAGLNMFVSCFLFLLLLFRFPRRCPAGSRACRPPPTRWSAKSRTLYAHHCCFQANFDQLTVNVAMDMKDRFKGVMYVKKPGSIVLDVAAPERQKVGHSRQAL